MDAEENCSDNRSTNSDKMDDDKEGEKRAVTMRRRLVMRSVLKDSQRDAN